MMKEALCLVHTASFDTFGGKMGWPFTPKWMIKGPTEINFVTILLQNWLKSHSTGRARPGISKIRKVRVGLYSNLYGIIRF